VWAADNWSYAMSTGTLNDGQKISYDVERGQQGKTSAVNLRAS
jgi:cold shock CspA family protein